VKPVAYLLELLTAGADDEVLNLCCGGFGLVVFAESVIACAALRHCLVTVRISLGALHSANEDDLFPYVKWVAESGQ
jgi:hypothetical protein